jgi:uncharacterized protein (DUF427 family)
MPSQESLYHKHPDYRVELEPNPKRVRVELAGEVIADSTRTMWLQETKHEPVIYIPRDDVRFDKLTATDHQTFCPFKGDAVYWTVTVGERTDVNSVWGYPDPFEETADIKDYVAFYQDRFDWSDGE